MRIVTLSREFGSGGREVGKRLADALGFAYYDREIENALAQRMGLDPAFLARRMEQGVGWDIPLHFGRTFTHSAQYGEQVKLMQASRQLMEELAARSDCVIVGRAADVILADRQPLKIFVYADMDYKLSRCQSYGELDAPMIPREMEKAIRRMDSRRAQYHNRLLDGSWGDKARYHLCLNTTAWEIKALIPPVADFARRFFAMQGQG